jgi:hypothetical protein
MSRGHTRPSGCPRRLLAVAASTIGIYACQVQPAPLCPDVYSNVAVSVPAATFAPQLQLFAPINAATAAGATGTTVSIVSNQGTVSYGGRGPFQAFIFNRVPFPATNSITYAGLGVENGTWFPFVLYCSGDGRLTKVFGEMTDRDVEVFDDVDGTCTDQGVAPMAPVSLAANTLSPVALTCGFSVHSAAPPPNDVNLDSSQNGTMYGDSVALPFHAVDCRAGCGTPGWYELHTILWNQMIQEVSFEIVYLDDQGVSFTNGISLPRGDTATDEQFFGATFTIDR